MSLSADLRGCKCDQGTESATLLGSGKQYKRWLRTWGFRKNIRLTSEDESVLVEPPALDGARLAHKSHLNHNHIQLTSGLVVDAHRLAVHLRRRRAYLMNASGQPLPPAIRPPDTLLFSESALSHFRVYDVRACSISHPTDTGY